MSGPTSKHKLDGLGEASAAMVLASLAANPPTSFLAVGISGKIVFFILTRIFSGLASLGLVMLNVGAEKLSTIIDKHNFDGSWESAENIINEIRNSGRDMTPEETKKIDDEVIKSFRKFAKLARKK